MARHFLHMEAFVDMFEARTNRTGDCSDVCATAFGRSLLTRLCSYFGRGAPHILCRYVRDQNPLGPDHHRTKWSPCRGRLWASRGGPSHRAFEFSGTPIRNFIALCPASDTKNVCNMALRQWQEEPFREDPAVVQTAPAAKSSGRKYIAVPLRWRNRFAMRRLIAARLT